MHVANFVIIGLVLFCVFVWLSVASIWFFWYFLLLCLFGTLQLLRRALLSLQSRTDRDVRPPDAFVSLLYAAKKAPEVSRWHKVQP